MVESKPVTPLTTRNNSLAPSEANTDQDNAKDGSTTQDSDAVDNALLTAANKMKSKSVHIQNTDRPLAAAAGVRGTSPLSMQSMYPLNKPPPSDSPTEMDMFIDSLVTPGNHFTKDGMVTFADLYLPPPFLPSAVSKDSSFASLESLTSTASEDEAKRRATEKMARKSPHLSPLHSTSQRLPVKKKQPRSPVKSTSPRSPGTPPKSPSKARRKESTVAAAKNRSQVSPENKPSRKEKLLQPKRQAHCWLGKPLT